MLFAILPSSEHADHKAWRGASGQGLPTPPSGLRPRQLPFLPPPHRVRAGHPPALLALPPLLWLPLRLLCPLLKLPYPQDSSYAALGSVQDDQEAFTEPPGWGKSPPVLPSVPPALAFLLAVTFRLPGGPRLSPSCGQ